MLIERIVAANTALERVFAAASDADPGSKLLTLVFLFF